MLDSLEGKRGEVRAKPPIPAIKGLWGQPTAVNNVLTLCAVPMILADGGAAYAELGTGRSRGTQVFQLAGNIKQGGIVELPFGVSLRALVEDYGGGTLTGRPVRAAQVGGPLGAYVPADRLRRTHGLRGAGRVGRDARPRRHRRLRRDRRHGADGALRDGVLLHRVVRQVHAVPGRVDAGRRDHRPDHRRDTRRRGQPGAARRPVRDADEGVAVRDGRADPDAGAERDQALPARTSSGREHPYDAASAEHLGPRGRLRHAGGPRRRRPVSVTIDGRQVDVPAGTSVLRAATEAGVAIPKLCATDSLKAFGSCRMCLVEVDGAKGVPASCTTPCADGMVVNTQTDTVRELRRNVMELYLSDHPEDCDGCARGNCELQAMAAHRRLGRGPLRPARVARRRRPPAADRPEQPLLRLRRLLLHRLLPLRARLRRHPGHLRAHRRGTRLRLQDQRRRHRLHVLRVRLVRRLRAGLPDVRAPGALRRPARHAHPLRRDHLRLLRRRLLLPRRGPGRRRRLRASYG